MSFRQPRAAIWAIWAVVLAFAVTQALGIIDGGARSSSVVVQALVASAVMLILAFFATRRIERLASAVRATERAHGATLDEVGQLELSNAVLQVVARSVDVPLAFQALAQRIVRLVPCDRVGLALLSEKGQEFQTYTARVNQEERRARPRPDMVFKTERTAIGNVMQSREPALIDDTGVDAPEFLDVNVLHSAGLKSALLLPLVTGNRAVGTLNLVSRQHAAFNQQHVQLLQPIAEIFAVAHVAQQLQISVGKYRSMEVMSELTLSMAAEMNSALQTIIGHCDLLERGYPHPELQRDLATVVHQAQRISGLLDKMRAAAHDRLREVAETVNQGGVPESPEAFVDRQVT